MKVIGIGDNVVDKYLDKGVMYPGGNALNFSVYAKMFGVSASYLGVFGNDQAAEHIQQSLQDVGVEISHCLHYEGENGYAEVNLVDGDRVFVGSNKGGVQKDFPLILEPEILDYLKDFRITHSSIYSGIESELKKLKDLGVLVSYDFSNEFTESYLQENCPNIDVSLLSCGDMDEKEVKELLQRVHTYGSSLVIGTMGAYGAIVYDGSIFYHQKPKLVEAVDTLGAGDSFFSAFIIHYLQETERNSTFERGDVIQKSLQEGANFAAKTCLVEGAFGYGVAF